MADTNSTELAVINQQLPTDLSKLSEAELARLAGTEQQAQTGMIRLTINRHFDDDDGNTLPPGTWCVYDPATEQRVYGKEVTFRPLLFRIQYRHWDETAGEDGKGAQVNQSVIFSNWGEEAIDELGTERCGKPKGSVYKKLTADEQKRFKGISCYRMVFGLASITGVNAKGEKATVTDVPCVWQARGTNFTPASDVADKLANKMPWKYAVKMTLKREKNGDTVYYVAQPEVDVKTELDTPANLAELLGSALEYITDTNKAVFTKYKQSRRADQRNAEARAAEDVVDTIDVHVDLDDGLPESMTA